MALKKMLNSIVLRAIGLSPRAFDDAKDFIAQAKRTTERMTKEGWVKYFAACRIATEAGVLKECEQHDGFYFAGNEDIEEAYKLGNAEFTAGRLKGTFESRQEMTDVIKFAVYENSGGACEICSSVSSYG
jgi:hypothetical protein